jgi:Xaa-Pro aminopeptidase
MNFVERRSRFLNLIEAPVLLFSGGEIGRNYPANAYPFRADSNFLYFFEKPEAASAALFDPLAKEVTLFLPRRTVDDALWHGALASFAEMKATHRVHDVQPMEELETLVAQKVGSRALHSIAVADARTTQRAAQLTKEDLSFFTASAVGQGAVVDALASLRIIKDADELQEMRRLVPVTREAHVLAMQHSKPGVSEHVINGHIDGAFSRGGCISAYQNIVSVRGEVLHNHHHENTLALGDIVLADAGAESVTSGYCNDVTRCWPVGGTFSQAGRDIYSLVLKSEEAAIAAVKPGVRYRDIHLLSARVIAQGLKDLGLMHGDVDGLVESGAQAMFFPHGVGHQIGLDVHDMEAFGDRIFYPNGRTRSPQFGTGYLRMDMDLKAGMSFTIEPGIYFVPAILHSAEFRKKFGTQVDFTAAEKFLEMNDGRGFGGIRIEDDVVCTAAGVEVLTASIPKQVAEIEKLAASAAN